MFVHRTRLISQQSDLSANGALSQRNIQLQIDQCLNQVWTNRRRHTNKLTRLRTVVQKSLTWVVVFVPCWNSSIERPHNSTTFILFVYQFICDRDTLSMKNSCLVRDSKTHFERTVSSGPFRRERQTREFLVLTFSVSYTKIIFSWICIIVWLVIFLRNRRSSMITTRFYQMCKVQKLYFHWKINSIFF